MCFFQKDKTVNSKKKRRIKRLSFIRVYFGKHPARVPTNSLIIFPLMESTFYAGIAGIVYFKCDKKEDAFDIGEISNYIKNNLSYTPLNKNNTLIDLKKQNLEDAANYSELYEKVSELKNLNNFYQLLTNPKDKVFLATILIQLSDIISYEEKLLLENMGTIDSATVQINIAKIEKLKDIHWCIENELLSNISKIENFLDNLETAYSRAVLKIIYPINAVLNSLDRLEVRGRDSAGISLMFSLEEGIWKKFLASIKNNGAIDEFHKRFTPRQLRNRTLSTHRVLQKDGKKIISISIVYKVAVEIGKLGDNVEFLRKQISSDRILRSLLRLPINFFSVISHTRWASVGAITEANCHPIDNQSVNRPAAKSGIIHICLNGDIDNYLELMSKFELGGEQNQREVTTDAKIIPLVIDKFLNDGKPIDEAFRLAVQCFEGSHAISMHTDLAPGKIFLAQKGSGQSLFVGLGSDHYITTSDVSGIVEETSNYLKIDGENVFEGSNGFTAGQIFVLHQQSNGGLDGISAKYYDGTPITLSANNINCTEIISRDIDRQSFPHYYLKEIFESPDSVEKTLQNKWKIIEGERLRHEIDLDETAVPQSIKEALVDQKIKRIFFIGQGTAGIAAMAAANIWKYYLSNQIFIVDALKASELSGFQINEGDASDSMTDTLVIAVSQSGMNVDTNRTIDLIKDRGAHTVAIVHRRDSDITFKVDGVIYTSTGRDLEMSIASTKSFYSQIIAAAVMGLYIASLLSSKNKKFITQEIKELTQLPAHMRKIIANSQLFEDSAKRLSISRENWAVVGSGPNKAAADEIRIKLSELCYKTVSSDFVEDKKHFDLSSEPLIIICAAGTKSTVIGDLVKDTAIFRAHKATPIVIADEGENRFSNYAEDVFYVPHVSQHFSPILNTLVGHLWAYYAALAINEGSRFLYNFREKIITMVDEYRAEGLDIYEIILESSFRETIAEFYYNFRNKKSRRQIPITHGSDLSLLLKYLSGRLPISDFEIDFNQKGSPVNILNALFVCLGAAINNMARPVDAIKHQAKTVTVGTSRITEKIRGILFDTLLEMDFPISQLTNRNVIILKNLQEIIEKINDSALYRITGLNILGEPSENTSIEVIKKFKLLDNSTLQDQQSDRLKGTNRIVVSQGNVYMGRGRKDGRIIILIPILTSSVTDPNRIEFLLELIVSLRENTSLNTKIRALGGKYEHIKNLLQENGIPWREKLLELIPMEVLFGFSAEKICDYILNMQRESQTKKETETTYAEFQNETNFIKRSIYFPPEYYQAGISILNYFGTILRKKYPDQLATVRIEQEGKKVTMTIDPVKGDKEIIEKALDDYGLVITGQLAPEEYTDNRELILDLKNELRLAEYRVEHQKEINKMQRVDIVELRQLIYTAFKNPPPIQITTTANSELKSDIGLYFDITSYISLIKENLNEMLAQLTTESDEARSVEDFKDSLDNIKNCQSQEEISKSSTMSKFRKFIVELGDKDSNLGKIIKGVEKGADIARTLAGSYNKIAQWCGLPQVPEPIAKK